MRHLIISFNTHTRAHAHTQIVCNFLYQRRRQRRLNWLAFVQLQQFISFIIVHFTFNSSRSACVRMCMCVLGVCANIQWCLTFNTMLRCISPRDETSSDSKRNEGRLRFHLIWIWILFVFNLLKFIQSAKRALRNSIDAKKSKQQRKQIYVYIFRRYSFSGPFPAQRDGGRETCKLSWQSCLPHEIFYTCFTLDWRNYKYICEISKVTILGSNWWTASSCLLLSALLSVGLL